MCGSTWIPGLAFCAVALCGGAVLAGAPGLPKPCDDAGIWAAHLAQEYGEIYVKDVIVGEDAVSELWVDPIEGDWTILNKAGENNGQPQLCMWGYGNGGAEGWK